LPENIESSRKQHIAQYLLKTIIFGKNIDRQGQLKATETRAEIRHVSRNKEDKRTQFPEDAGLICDNVTLRVAMLIDKTVFTMQLEINLNRPPKGHVTLTLVTDGCVNCKKLRWHSRLLTRSKAHHNRTRRVPTVASLPSSLMWIAYNIFRTNTRVGDFTCVRARSRFDSRRCCDF